jgi:hypothetical protein
MGAQVKKYTGPSETVADGVSAPLPRGAGKTTSSRAANPPNDKDRRVIPQLALTPFGAFESKFRDHARPPRHQRIRLPR